MSASDLDMLDKYDFSKGIRGKYAQRYAAGTNIVLLYPDLIAIFLDSQAVNEALRTLVHITRENMPLTSN